MSNNASQIIIPIDFGEQSMIALRQSYNLARLTKSEITLLHVIDSDFLKPFQDIVSANHNYENQLRDELSNRLQELGAKVQSEAGVRVNILTRTGKI